MILLLACAATLLPATSPGVAVGTAGSVIGELVSMGRLAKDSTCDGLVRDIPIQVALQPDAEAEPILANLLDAEWQTSGGVRMLVRSRDQRRRMEREQVQELETRVARIVEKWTKKRDAISLDPSKLGHQIQRDLEEYVRTSGRSGANLSMPLDLVRIGCLLDIGQARFARLGLDQYVYASNVVDGVHEPLGAQARQAFETYRKVLDEPAVREALDKARDLVRSGTLQEFDPRNVRVIFWAARTSRGISSWITLYSRDGRLLDFRGGIDDLGQPSPAESPLLDAPLRSGDLSRLIARVLAERQSAPNESIKRLLLDGALFEPIARDVLLSLAEASPGRSIALKLDESWFRTWANELGRPEPTLRKMMAGPSSGGCRLTETSGCVYLTPALQRDSEQMLIPREAFQRYVADAFSPSGASLESLCKLVSAIRQFSAFNFGITGSYLRLAEGQGAGTTFDTRLSDFYMLKAIAGSLPLPTSDVPLKRFLPQSVQAQVVRHALAYPFLEKAPTLTPPADITQRSSIYGDGEVWAMPWEIRLVRQAYYSRSDVVEASPRPQSRPEILRLLSNVFVHDFNRSEEALAAFELYRGEGSQYDVAIWTSENSAWLARIGVKVKWAGKAIPLRDLPDGKGLMRDAMRMATDFPGGSMPPPGPGPNP